MPYAIFKTRGQQFRAEPGRTVQIPLMEVDPGATVTFDEVLLSSDGETVTTGAPTVAGASVTGEVIGHVAGKKLYVFRFKRRKNYRKKTGHRQKYTQIMITEVKAG
jgi:large subunit ribosomal protein L21